VTVVLLHAFPLDERMWEPQRALVPDAITPRLYGRGQTMDAWADSIAGEIDDEDLVLVGASMGGYCALALARRAPERVRGLLLCGARPDADSEERRAGRAKTIQLIRDDGAEALWQDMVPKLFADPAHADTQLLFRDEDGLVGAVEAIRDRADSTAIARELGSRARFVIGESDPFVSADELHEFEVREIAGAGHLANLERPDEFNRELRDFLAGV
jgi:pimeloyl-ACP methyl ester carboxylesterase